VLNRIPSAYELPGEGLLAVYFPETGMAATKKKKAGRTSGGKKSVGSFAKGVRSWIIKFALSLLGIFLIVAALPPLFILIYAIPEARPASTPIIARVLTGEPVERFWVPLGEVSPVLMHSVIMSEDGRFCEHSGVDWEALNTVIDDALDGEPTRGASTISMQTMKNLFLWPQRSFIRKGLEIPMALLADAIWSKRRMLEIYLNIAEWDDGVYGIGAAARHYFRTTPAKLNRRQAALLTVTLPSPRTRNPAKPTKSLNRLANTVEKRARQAGAYVGCLSE
jgi:monofunctional biosynthetic peptidoglycan transglycosylase